MLRYTVATAGAVLLAFGFAQSVDETHARGLSSSSAQPALATGHIVRPSMRSGARDTPRVGSAAMPIDSQNHLVHEYCSGCHDNEAKTGGLSLEDFDAGRIDQQAELAEKMIRKLRAGMMPPPTATSRPDAATVKAFAAALEARIDEVAAKQPNPGRRPFQRLNRAEYGRSVHDLLGIDVDVEAFLPADTVSHNFDNIADVQSFSATMLEGYLRAATKISNLAVGNRAATPSETTYKVPRTANQLHHVEGAPFGTRGGVSVVHTFPADGEYVFRMMLHSIPTGQLYGSPSRGEQIEVSINGARAALVDINPRMSEADPNGMNIQTPPIAVKAGPQRVTAAFITRFDGPVDDLLAPIEYTLADTQIGSAIGVTVLPHLRDLAITGPYRVTGVSETPSRRRIFTCRPMAANEERPCARQILSSLTTQAYRRPAGGDLESLLKFYETARREGDFESGIRMALQAILASPYFVFRFEQAPAAVRPGQNYRIGDVELASRLSYFLWATSPDAELLNAARLGTLRAPAVLDTQVRRMLGDSRSEALATRFAAQWLRLQDLDKIHPDALAYSSYDATLADAMRRETELLFDHVVHADRNVLELLTADYTFVNGRLARHYGIPNITGPTFERVQLADENRRGILGHGSILMQTSVADRTSPVLRGKWIMEVLLGSPPPPPPPNVPAFEETKAVTGDKTLTVRERMEAHRKNPDCTSCHRVIDPLGLALENFDVTGAWRIKDNGHSIDASGTLYDGTALNGPATLRQALLNHSETVLRTFTENLMAYALGRRIEYFDMPTIRAIIQKAGQNDLRFSSFVMGIVHSAAFQMSRAETTTDQ
jgi:cytochrome c551/c552